MKKYRPIGWCKILKDIYNPQNEMFLKNKTKRSAS